MRHRRLEEVAYVRILQDLRPDLLEHAHLQAAEAPDVLCRVADGSAVGVEVTKYFRSVQQGQRPLQEQEALRDRIAALASEKFEQAGGPPLIVGVHFNPHYRIQKSEVHAFAEALAVWVRLELPAANESTTLEPTWPREAFMPPPVHAVSLGRFDSITRGHWSVPSADWMPSLDPDEIQSILRKKEQLVSDYRRAVGTVWLLIVAEGRLSSTVDVADGLTQVTFKSSFDKGFFLQLFEGRVFELGLAA